MGPVPIKNGTRTNPRDQKRLGPGLVPVPVLELVPVPVPRRSLCETNGAETNKAETNRLKPVGINPIGLKPICLKTQITLINMAVK